MEAGIDDVGIGVLYGLYDWKFETLALFQHIKYLEGKFGIGPHTISVPRLEPATGSEMAGAPPYEVQDEAGGIAHALSLAKGFVGSDKFVVILGDNIIEDDLSDAFKDFKDQANGAKIFLKTVENPKAYGVAEVVDEKIV